MTHPCPSAKKQANKRGALFLPEMRGQMGLGSASF